MEFPSSESEVVAKQGQSGPIFSFPSGLRGNNHAYTVDMAKKLPMSASFHEPPPFMMGDDKRSVILRAAHTLFLKEGYAETSMDAVTSAAGVSKATVYSHFASKEKLFEVLVKEGSDNAIKMFPRLQRQGGDVSREMTAFFEPLLTILFAGGGYTWDRMVARESSRQPQNAKLFYECTIQRITTMLAGYIEALIKEGLSKPLDSKRAAEALMSIIVVGPLHRAMLLGAEKVNFRESLRFGLAMFIEWSQPKK